MTKVFSDDGNYFEDSSLVGKQEIIKYAEILYPLLKQIIKKRGKVLIINSDSVQITGCCDALQINIRMILKQGGV